MEKRQSLQLARQVLPGVLKLEIQKRLIFHNLAVFRVARAILFDVKVSSRVPEADRTI
jgi:hypothetical protein